MVRKGVDQRFQDLISAAIQIFLAQGYRRTQIADVAKASGMAKGTVYLYVTSKEALFDLTIRYADATIERGIIPLPPVLPVPTPEPSSTLQFVQNQLIESDPVPLLTVALRQEQATDVRSELAGIVRQLYAKLNRHRVSMKLIDCCAHDYPELAAVFFKAGRETVMQALVRYLELRIQQGLLRPVPDVAIAARILLEVVAYWSIHRYWDPSPQRIDDSVAEDTVVDLLIHTLSIP